MGRGDGEFGSLSSEDHSNSSEYAGVCMEISGAAHP